MNGIDTSAASLLASRIGALGPTGAQSSAGTAQTGVSALAGGAIALPDAQSVDTPQASAQTVLSAVALALDAIIRSGGEATPAVVGRAPVWSDPDAADAGADAQSLPLPGLTNPASAAAQALEAALLAEVEAQAGLVGAAQDGADAADTANATYTTNAANAASAQNTQSAAGVALAAQAGPVAALAASLAQTVAQSGLFYESHLAQWLRGQRTPGDLADEPQNRLTGGGAQLPLDWASSPDDIDDVFWTELPNAAQQGARAAANAAQQAPGTSRGAETNAAFAQEAARGHATSLLGDTLLPAVHTPGGAGASAGVHEALLPLVRQQLDLLATGEFRWTGEAWPGVRLDWTIQPDEYDPRDPGNGGRGTDEDATPWHTRLTLALPSLGTVDAELTLTGKTLAVRVQASPGGAQRLTDNSEALRGRLEALGLALAGLSIREIGGGTVHASAADAARAADAYARNAAAPAPEHHAAEAATATAAAATTDSTDPNDWERG
ncbi:flagellar hook-length control protein FliK [Paraburkholderia sp. Ac-20340]|uniref:flagellar hook-length control protein FliK n=1 Tax=Paraburkholderia sp. Ac-20340 TaxID=2703888 RepID=UPI00197FD1D6|nr:flagellar hook-length control protein FliK [Paraburkholderia sp. Ac-20340]MBN3858228.1 flagellar hook-length control protein FliK [Paraburkholderia sp. Ac-20340]